MNTSTHQKKHLPSLAVSCLIASGLFAAPAHSASLTGALKTGKANVDMRLRYETADDSINKEATAATLRTRLGYTTGDFKDTFGFAEFEDVRVIGSGDDYGPGKSGYTAIADPEVTQLNQAFIGYKGFSNATVKVGRQRIILDNARFVGNVGWRQNEQTFDALSFVSASIPDTTIKYAYLDKINGILTKFDADVSSHLINVSYAGFKPANITGYAYLLEDDDTDANNDTYGIRVKGATALSSSSKLMYTAELASQSTDDNDATYTFIEGAMKFGGVTAKVGYEILGSDSGTYGFQTPLATKHAFNGWADQFLGTPADGLQDLMLTVTGKLAGMKLLAVYHDYAADEGSADYGSEVNLLAAKKFGKTYTLGLKYAGYSADTWKTDTDKVWLWGQLKI